MARDEYGRTRRSLSKSRSRSRSRNRNRRHSSRSRERGREDRYSRRDRSRSPRTPSHRQNRFARQHDEAYYKRRAEERESIKFSIWRTFPSPSPERPKDKAAENSPDQVKKRQSPSASEGSSSEESTDSEEERRRRLKRKRKEKKEKKRVKKEKKKSKRKRKRRRSPSKSSSSESEHHESEDDQVPLEQNREAQEFRAAVQSRREGDDEEIIGPQPLPDIGDAAKDSTSYGKALLPGEGAAIAQFVQKNMRIPRRGEVGWQGNEIEQLEDLGYVMSGSRHARMNAVRLRKENQVYSAEEKRALALINFEEKQQREAALMGDFRSMLTDRLTKKHGTDIVEDAVHEHK